MANVNISKVYLLRVPLESDYKHTLYFTSKAAQQEYFMSKKVSGFDNDNFSYQRKDNVIRVNKHIDEILTCNYVMYQNSYYTNKWFYCFIKNMKYINDGVTEVEIETDVIQTWLFDYNIKESFVEREHVDDDTIGLHTVPECLETGEYICNAEVQQNMGGEMYIVVATTQAYETKVKGCLYGGCYSGLYYMVWSIEDYELVNNFLNYMDEHAHSEAIASIFILPKFIVEDIEDLDPEDPEKGSILPGRDTASQKPFVISKAIPSLSYSGELDGYVPTNHKLYTFPYNYLLASNNVGGSAIYKYEDFKTTKEGNESDCCFQMYGVACPGGSIKIVPEEYKGVTLNYEESLNAGKFPVCNWNSDVYINWLTQNAMNIPLSIASSALTALGGIGLSATGGGAIAGVGAVASGTLGIAQTLGQIHQHSLVPPQAEGNVNSGDVLAGCKRLVFSFYKMSIKKEYLQIIDKYFDMFGYKVNMVKLPNKAHRTRYWYTKTIDINIDGNIPNNDMQKIKDCYNNGITFWRNGNEIQNYSLSNAIV